MFECATDGRTDEISIYEAFLEASFWGGILILIVEVSSYFVISPLQVDPLSRRTLIPIQVQGEFHGVSFGMHEVLFLYR